jgi:hypothetical protein
MTLWMQRHCVGPREDRLRTYSADKMAYSRSFVRTLGLSVRLSGSAGMLVSETSAALCSVETLPSTGEGSAVVISMVMMIYVMAKNCKFKRLFGCLVS